MNDMKLGITLIAAAVALAGCGEQKPAAKAEAKPAAPSALEVKIGHVGPLTGGIAHLGKDNENGARLAVQEAHAARTRTDGQEVKFTFVAEDDQPDPTTGTTAAQQLVAAKVAGVPAHP